MKSSTLVVFATAVCGTAIRGIRASTGNAQRPFHIIAHMANSIETMDSFIMQGANGVEVDVSFEKNGAAWTLYHGVPCDMFRKCTEKTAVVDYLNAAANRPLAILFLDLKCSKLDEAGMTFGGVDLARKLVGHFWNKGGSNISVILSVPYIRNRPLLASFIKELRELDASRLRQVSYDTSADQDLGKIAKMYRDLNVTAAWQGDGITNWFEHFRGFSRVREVIRLRDQGNSVYKKVYRWTVDWKGRIRQLMEMGIDGIMTNKPFRAEAVLKEIKDLRLATPYDSVNECFQG